MARKGTKVGDDDLFLVARNHHTDRRRVGTAPINASAGFTEEIGRIKSKAAL
jgi:hypothetical protein